MRKHLYFLKHLVPNAMHNLIFSIEIEAYQIKSPGYFQKANALCIAQCTVVFLLKDAICALRALYAD